MRISDWSSDVCSSDLWQNDVTAKDILLATREGFTSIEHVKRYTTTGMATDQGKLSNLNALDTDSGDAPSCARAQGVFAQQLALRAGATDRKSTRLNSSH